MTIPPLTTIVDAVRSVRAQLEPDVDRLAAAILAGDEQALAIGRELMKATDQLVADLAALAHERHADHLEIEHCLGIDPIIDAVLIAIGEQESDDAEVNERFRPVRLDRQRWRTSGRSGTCRRGSTSAHTTSI